MALYSDLPREGPGTVDSLLKVLEIADPPPLGRILNAGCGSGADSETLLRVFPGAEVLGIEQQPAFVEAANARGLRAQFTVGDMMWPPGAVDLIWCAGAIYFVGIETALEAWRSHLRLGGKIAFSEIAWMRNDVNPAAKAFWDEAYPGMSSAAALERRIEACGYRILMAEPLGRAGWEGYYDALRRNIEAKQGQSAEMDAVIAETAAEIDVFDQHFGDFDYMVFLVEPI